MGMFDSFRSRLSALLDATTDEAPMPVELHTALTWDIEIEVEAEDGLFLAKVKHFNVNTFGESVEEVLANAVEAFDSYVATLVELNELIPTLDELGVKYEQRSATRHFNATSFDSPKELQPPLFPPPSRQVSRARVMATA